MIISLCCASDLLRKFLEKQLSGAVVGYLWQRYHRFDGMTLLVHFQVRNFLTKTKQLKISIESSSEEDV